MNFRRLLSGVTLLLVGVSLLLVVVNLRVFDEPLIPEIESLRSSPPVALDGNAFPLAVGFLAAEGRDPRAAGLQIIAERQARRERGAPVSLPDDEMRAILGAPLADRGLEGVLSFHCQARHRLDCAARLVARLESLDLDDPRLALLFDRYESLLAHTQFGETPTPDLETPWPPLGRIVALGRLRLASSLRDDPTPVFLEKAAQDLRFWRMVLRDGQLLGMKMVALAAIRNTGDLVSELMRQRQLQPGELDALRRAVRPFTHEERDIGPAFLAEARAFLLAGSDPIGESSWFTRLLMQRNATFNLYYRQNIEPLRLRSSLDAREYHRRGAFKPLDREVRFSAGMLYNIGGKLALSRSAWDAHHFPSRVHDEDGRIALLLIQAEMEERPGTDVATLVRSSAHRNPYTGEPMEYDPGTRRIGFVCLHTAFHPPEPDDLCAVDPGTAAR